jgi:pimeloyl-ACP methyl ester carboxylesterase
MAIDQNRRRLRRPARAQAGRQHDLLLGSLGISNAAIVGHSFGGMLAVYFARDCPETTQVLVLENPIGLEDYRSAIPPQPLETLIKTEMSQTPQSFLIKPR